MHFLMDHSDVWPRSVKKSRILNEGSAMPEREMVALAIIAVVIFVAAITAAFTAIPWFPLGG